MPSETPILDERAVSEIEAGARLDQCLKVVSSAVTNCLCRRPAGHLGAHSESVPPYDVFWIHPAIPALCATVKQLRRERDEAIKARDLYVSLKWGQQERADEIEARALELLQERDSLQSQLEQLRAENERLRNQVAGEKALDLVTASRHQGLGMQLDLPQRSRGKSRVSESGRDVMTNGKAPDYRRPHVFDPIHNGADECDCGLTSESDIHESDEAYEERMHPRIINAPERIWLQVGCDDEVGEIDWKKLSHSDVSWCDQRIDNTDIEYVRADPLATRLKEAREEARAAMLQSTHLKPLRRERSKTMYDSHEVVMSDGSSWILMLDEGEFVMLYPCRFGEVEADTLLALRYVEGEE